MEETSKPLSLEAIKENLYEIRARIDSLSDLVKNMIDSKPEKGIRELSLVRTKLQEAKMWCGKALEELGHKLPPEFLDKIQ